MGAACASLLRVRETAAPRAAEDRGLLSTRKIPRAQRLIFALDVPDAALARDYVRELGAAVQFYKVGLELFVKDGAFALVDELLGAGKQVFADLKLFDVAETIGRAVRNLGGRRGLFVTVHAYDAALKAAVQESGGVEILAVTVLTNLDQGDLRELGYPPELKLAELVLARARRALALGCHGVVASALEAARLRRELGERLAIVTPGIRPFAERPAGDDQKRVTTPREAFLAGADYIVVGRPIRDARDPRAAAEQIQAEIAELFPG
jgi:orotidine-5'-phosphate decarboxylase